MIYKWLVKHGWLKISNPHEWRKSPIVTSLGEGWNYVDLVTGRMDDAEITYNSRDGHYKVWNRGGCYGEFGTLEQAQIAGESRVKSHYR